MKTKSKLERLPTPVKAELIEKILTTSGQYDQISQWLHEVHGHKHSKSAICRFAQAVKLMYSGLADLGMPSTALTANAGKLEKLGVYLVQRELLNRRIDDLRKDIFGELPLVLD